MKYTATSVEKEAKKKTKEINKFYHSATPNIHDIIEKIVYALLSLIANVTKV